MARSVEEYEAGLARLVVRVGANVAEGQDVTVLVFDVSQSPIARKVAEEAYRAGARVVSVIYWDQHVKRSRLRHAPAETLGIVPGWWQQHLAEAVEGRNAYIVIWGDPDPTLLDGIAADRLGADQMPLIPAVYAAFGGGEVKLDLRPRAVPGSRRSGCWGRRT